MMPKNHKMDESISIPTNHIEASLQNQIIAAFICTSGAFCFGCSLGWLSMVKEDLILDDDGPLDSHMEDDELIWAKDLIFVGAIVGQLLFSVVAKKRGRKVSAYVGGLPLLIAFVIKLYADSATWILVSQFFCGMGGAGTLSLPPLYISEVCEARAKGGLSSLVLLQLNLGIFLTHLLGTLVSYETLNAVLVPTPLVFLLAFWFMPETPLYRLKKGEEEPAARAVAWLRKLPLNSVEVRTELLDLARQLRGADALETEYKATKEDLAKEMEWLQPRHVKYPRIVNKRLQLVHHQFKSDQSSWNIMKTTRSTMYGLALCILLVTSQILSGFSIISSFTSFVIESIHISLSTKLCLIVYSVFLVIGCLLGSVLMELAGRRFLQINSCFVVFLGELILAIFFQYFDDENPPAQWISWTAFFVLIITMASFSMGPCSVTFVILTEYFTAEVRDIVNVLVMMYIWILGLLLNQIFPLTLDIIGTANIFYFFSILSLVSCILSYILIPETKAKTHIEIIRMLNENNLSSNKL